MYRVILINLTSEARAVSLSSQWDFPNLAPDALRQILGNFCEIDEIENSSADTEIRILVRQENYLLRTAQKKLVLYDMRQRELPGQILGLDEVMAELDGSAATARFNAIKEMRANAEPWETERTALTPSRKRSKWPVLSLIVALLLVANLLLKSSSSPSQLADFTRIASADLPAIQRSLTGVYLTGSEPGNHGIVVTGPRELKLFELGVIEAPRVVYASFSLGEIGTKRFLSTDQPGGLIEIKNDGSLVYCGENYRRIP